MNEILLFVLTVRYSQVRDGVRPGWCDQLHRAVRGCVPRCARRPAGVRTRLLGRAVRPHPGLPGDVRRSRCRSRLDGSGRRRLPTLVDAHALPVRGRGQLVQDDG